jgi:hypothetical protein
MFAIYILVAIKCYYSGHYKPLMWQCRTAWRMHRLMMRVGHVSNHRMGNFQGRKLSWISRSLYLKDWMTMMKPILYSGKPSREKTFTDFMFCEPPTKVFSTKFRHVQVTYTIVLAFHENFLREMLSRQFIGRIEFLRRLLQCSLALYPGPRARAWVQC